MKQATSRPALRRRAFNAAAVALAATAVLGAQGAHAEDSYPSRPINLVVGFPPGGSNDVVARIIAPKLGELLGTTVVVVNKPGSNALIGTDFVARAAPDGYTLTLASASPLAISPHTYAKIPFDPIKDLTGITTVAATPEMVAVHPSVHVKNLQELVALSKTRQVTLSSSGNGGLPHLAIELLRTVSKGNFLHVPYKGAGPAVTDTMGGHVDGVIMDLPALQGAVKGGTLNALAVTNTQRSPVFPQVPTSREEGFPTLLAFNWFAVLGPAKLPKPIVDKLYKALMATVKSPDVQKAMANVGVEPMSNESPQAFETFMQGELQRWGKVARESGARAD
jgi:tripartite-type tricarboxylate transporter receptor subunit TctC